MRTVPSTIILAKYSLALAIKDADRSAFKGPVLDYSLPEKIECMMDAVEDMYTLDSSYDGLTEMNNRLFSLLGRYATIAAANVGTSLPDDGLLTPVPDSDIYPLHIQSADFSDATNYVNADIVGDNLVIFVNEINRYIFAGEGFDYTGDGIEIRTGENDTIPGFDATTGSYHMIIYKVNT